MSLEGRRAERRSRPEPRTAHAHASPRRDDAGPAPDISGAASLDVQTLLQLQHRVGNQAVAQLVAQRRTRVGPTADPKFQALTRDVLLQ